MDELDAPALPLYVQIAHSIAGWIRSNRLLPGDRLPSERQLAAELRVSRMTVRQALGVLAHQGLISSQHGIGSFVARPRLEQPVDVLIGFSDNLVKRGMKPGARLLDLRSVLADRVLAAALQIQVGEMVFAIRRLRLANEMAVALENSYFPERYVPGLDERDLERRSIYAILAEDYGIQLAGALQTLEPVVARPHEAKLLATAKGAPLMLVTRTSSDAHGRAVEYAKDLYRGDCFRFVSHAHAPME
jgi:GntR family transcriptional regulator